MNENVRRLVAFLLETGLASPARLRGCTDDEVAELQAEMGVTLPAAYVDYLRAGGKEAGIFLVGNDAWFSKLAASNREARRLALANGVSLPVDAFVFYMHDGYEFYFFRCLGDNDPQVFYYHETDPVRAVGVSLSEWWLLSAEAEYKLDQQRPSWRRRRR